MTEQLPTTTPEQQYFYRRVGEKMGPMLRQGLDLREAQRRSTMLVAEQMRVEGLDAGLIDALLAEGLRLADSGLAEADEGVPVSDELEAALLSALEDDGFSPVRLLVEKQIAAKTGYSMFVFPNESKHPGRPHVTVLLADEKVNISISASPELLAGKANLPGIASVLKAVKRHRKALRKEWDALRPDDQKLENTKRRRSAEAKAGKSDA